MGLMSLNGEGCGVYLTGNTHIWVEKPNKYKIILPVEMLSRKKKRQRKHQHKSTGFRLVSAEGYPNVLWDVFNNTMVLDLVKNVFENVNPIQIYDFISDDLEDEFKIE